MVLRILSPLFSSHAPQTPHQSRPDNGKSKLDSELDPLTKDFNELREQLRVEGFYDPSMLHVAYRLSEIVVMHAAGFWLLSQGW